MFIILCQATLIAAIQQWQHLSTPSPFIHIQLSREKRRHILPVEHNFYTQIFERDRRTSTWRTFAQSLRRKVGSWIAKVWAHSRTHVPRPQPKPPSLLCANQTFRRTLFVFAMLKLITEFPQELIIIPFPGQEVLPLCKAHGSARKYRTVLCQ